jgi:RNA polymerase sigma-70 factor (ECF subfamily)
MSDKPDPDLLRRVEEAIENLPSVQREIFLAHRVDKMSYAEIAAKTGLPVRRVERHMASSLYRIARQVRRGRKLSWWQRWF